MTVLTVWLWFLLYNRLGSCESCPRLQNILKRPRYTDARAAAAHQPRGPVAEALGRARRGRAVRDRQREQT